MIYLVDFPCDLRYNRIMALSSGVKFRCYPTEEQARSLTFWMNCQRYIYNAKVGEERYFRKFRDKALSLTGIDIPFDQQYSHFKDRSLTPHLFEVPSQVLRNGATRFMMAYKRFISGLASRPVFRKNRGRQTVWLTSELFRFEPTGRTRKRNGKIIYGHKLMLRTKSHGLGELRFKAHVEYNLPSTITVSRDSGKWYVSFSFEKAGSEMAKEVLIDLYSHMGKQELEQVSVGLDRGLYIPVAESTGDTHGFKKVELFRMARKDRRRKRYQRQMARRTKGSGNWKRSLREAHKSSEYAMNVRKNFAHQASRKIVDGSCEVIFFEDLNIKGMTAKPKPKPNGHGGYLPNGAAAKAGLSKAILDSAWGKVKLFTNYKAQRLNKLVLSIPPHGTSQECSRCGHTHPDNRLSQAGFECTSCGFTENADINAARVIKSRGIAKLIAGEFTVKAKKRAMRLKKKAPLGQGLPDVMRGERHIRRHIGETAMLQASLNRETPTIIAA